MLVSVLGAAVMTGWWLNINALKVIVPGADPLKPNVAAGFLLSGLALLLLSGGKWACTTATPNLSRSFPCVPLVTGASAFAVTVLGVLTLAEHLLNWNLGIGHWLFGSTSTTIGSSYPQRMHPVTAFGFAMIGSALLLGTQPFPIGFRFPLAAGLSATVALTGLLPLTGFLLEIVFGPQWNFLGMSLSGICGATSFLMLGAGLLSLLHSKGELEWSLNGLTTAGFAIGILLTALTTGFGFDYARQMLQTNTAVAHRQEILKELESGKSGITDLLNSERIYVILGEERLLNDRPEIKKSVAKNFAAIRQLIADNPRQQSRLDDMESVIDQRIEWEEKVIATRREQGSVGAAELIATGVGIRLMERIRGLVKEMETEEHRLLGDDEKALQLAAARTFLVLPMGVFISAGVLSLAVFFLNAGATERVQAGKALRNREAQLHSILGNLDQGVVASDLDGRLLHWNPAALRLHGYSASEQDRRVFTELTDTFALSLLDGTPIPVDQWPLARILHGEQMREMELAVHRIGTDWRRIFSYGGTLVQGQNGQALMAIVTINDITERKRAEEAFQSSLKEISDLKEALDQHAIVATTDPQGKITYVNDKFCAISQYSREELLGQDHRVINSGHHPKEFIRNLWATIGRGVVWKGEIKNRAKDGSYYWVDTTIVPFLNEQGKPRQYVAIRADITERKEGEEQIRNLNSELEIRVAARTAELEAANKELEAFSYSVSHDLRAPLRAVDGFSAAVLEDYGSQLPEEGRNYLETIRNGAQRMGMLIDDLLTFSRLSRTPLNRQNISAISLVREALAELSPQQKDREVDLRIGALPPCHGDPALLKQVWINLISNALKYTRKRQAAEIEIGSTSTDDEIVYFISDNGVGFDMQYADKLFGVFQRLHRPDEFEGTGVGLAIVQRIVRRHDGRIWAKAAPDLGAGFYFTLGNGKES